MESLNNEIWDVVIAGTSLSQSLLALALSKCDVKVLHVDKNTYYGGTDAGLSLDEAQKWVGARGDGHFTITDKSHSGLGPSRAYTISLKPQIIYAKSRFLPTLVSSHIHTQLEFQAVGSFWIHAQAELKKIPSSREDVFADDTLSVRDKRRLMNLLRYVLEERDNEAGDFDANTSLETKLRDQFKISDNLRPPVQALTLSAGGLANINFGTAMARMRRHLMSMGYFGPGLAAVMAKYGGNSEIVQVACRAGAVSGFVYLLGHGIISINSPPAEGTHLEIELSDGTRVKAKHVVGMRGDLPPQLTLNLDSNQGVSSMLKVAHRISIVSTPLRQLFTSASENGPVPAVAVILVSSGEDDQPQVYLQVHSEDTGECPSGQTIIYASTLDRTPSAQERLGAAIDDLLSTVENSDEAKVLWNMSFTLEEAVASTSHNYSLGDDDLQGVIMFPERTHDIVFDDSILDNVKAAWQVVLGGRSTEYEFLRFGERKDTDEDE